VRARDLVRSIAPEAPRLRKECVGVPGSYLTCRDSWRHCRRHQLLRRFCATLARLPARLRSRRVALYRTPSACCRRRLRCTARVARDARLLEDVRK
jgi:hypothetical protein